MRDPARLHGVPRDKAAKNPSKANTPPVLGPGSPEANTQVLINSRIKPAGHWLNLILLP